MSETISKDDYNHLIDLYNRRGLSDVIGVTDQEYRALGKVLNEMIALQRLSNETSTSVEGVGIRVRNMLWRS